VDGASTVIHPDRLLVRWEAFYPKGDAALTLGAYRVVSSGVIRTGTSSNPLTSMERGHFGSRLAAMLLSHRSLFST
jgi:hypothetical protein